LRPLEKDGLISAMKIILKGMSLPNVRLTTNGILSILREELSEPIIEIMPYIKKDWILGISESEVLRI